MATVVECFFSLVETIKVEEDEVYCTKTALSLGRSRFFTISRLLYFTKSNIYVGTPPKFGTEISIQDPHPTCELRRQFAR